MSGSANANDSASVVSASSSSSPETMDADLASLMEVDEQIGSNLLGDDVFDTLSRKCLDGANVIPGAGVTQEFHPLLLELGLAPLDITLWNRKTGRDDF